MVKSMTDTPTHRVIRAFPLDGGMAQPGDLVSDAKWTYQGIQNVESKGWVERLSRAEILDWQNDQATPTLKTAEVKPPAAKKAPAKKRAPRKRVVKKTAL